MKLTSLLFILSIYPCSAADTTPQTDVQLARYVGRWYEQARFENWFEKGMDAVYTDYKPGPDSSLYVTNSGTNEAQAFKQASGRAYPGDNGVLHVSFVWPYWWFRAPYHILYVDADYMAALVSGDADSYLWLLTREPHPHPSVIRRLIKEAKLRGFDTSKLRFTKHK